MAVLDRINRAVATVRSVVTIIGWLGLTSVITGIGTIAFGTVWAVITGVSLPIIIMAAFCTFTGMVYLAMAPMAFRALQRVQETPARVRPSADIWRHLPTLEVFEAACLLADIDPDFATVSNPGDANGWYRALVEAIKKGEITHIPNEFESEHTFMVMTFDGRMTEKTEYRPYENTIISREQLQKFSKARGLQRAFLL